MANEAENAIYNRLASAPTFHPSSMSLFAQDWALEPGDVVQVESGEETYGMPVYGINFEWKGMNGGESKAVIQSSGNQKREPLPALRRMNYGTRSAIKQQETKFTADIQQVQNDLGAQIGLVVTQKDGQNVIKAASIAVAINEAGSAAAIDADQIYLNGNVIVGTDSGHTGLTAPLGKFDYLVVAPGANNVSLAVDNYGTKVRGELTVFSTGGTPNDIRDAIYSISEDQNPPSGKIGFVYTTFADPSTEHKVNFNIAATQTYIDGVAAATAAVDFSSESLWNNGNKVLTLSNNRTHTVTIPDPTGYSSAKIADKRYSISFTAGGKSFTYSQIDTSGSYEAGWGASYNEIAISPSSAQPLNPGGSVTVYAKGKATSDGNLTNKDSVTISAATDANLVAGNIKSGVTIFGVEGTYSGGSSSASDILLGSISYTPSYSAGGQSITTWQGAIRNAVQNGGYVYFDAYISGGSGDTKRYYMRF